MKAIQYFDDEYLKQCKKMSVEQIAEFLEMFRLMHQPTHKTKLISLKVQEPLLAAFRTKCELNNVKYQTQIKKLMEDWLVNNEN